MPAAPTKLPRWADSPPTPPPTTIVEPSEPEKDEGFQPGSLARVVEIVVVTAANSSPYNLTLNGEVLGYVSDSSATKTEIRDGLIAAIGASGSASKVTTSTTGSDRFRITANVAGQAFSVTALDARCTQAEITPNRTGRVVRQYLNWLFSLIYGWIAFLSACRFALNDFFNDLVVPGSETLPGTGAGLDGDSGGAIAYVAGCRVDATAGNAHTYAASSDTYIDIGYDGTWHYAVVGNGDSAPAITSGCARLFKVATNATDRTAASIVGTRWLALKQALIAATSGLDLGTSITPWRTGYFGGVVADSVQASSLTSESALALSAGGTNQNASLAATGTGSADLLGTGNKLANNCQGQNGLAFISVSATYGGGAAAGTPFDVSASISCSPALVSGDYVLNLVGGWDVTSAAIPRPNHRFSGSNVLTIAFANIGGTSAPAGTFTGTALVLRKASS